MKRKKTKVIITVIFKDELEKKIFYKIAKLYDNPSLSDQQKKEICEEIKKEIAGATNLVA